MDDELVDDVKFTKKSEPILAPKTHGLFIGGLPQKLQEEFSQVSFRIQMGFMGCIQNLHFKNE
jgi:hypothetical protein